MAGIIVTGYAEAVAQKLREAADAIEKDAACVTGLKLERGTYGEKECAVSFKTSEHTFGKIQWQLYQ